MLGRCTQKADRRCVPVSVAAGVFISILAASGELVVCNNFVIKKMVM